MSGYIAYIELQNTTKPGIYNLIRHHNMVPLANPYDPVK